MGVVVELEEWTLVVVGLALAKDDSVNIVEAQV